jgi:hypothetical protein
MQQGELFMADTNTAIIEATLYWPNLDRPNDMSGKYQVDLGNLDDAALKILKGLGIEPRDGSPKKDTDPDKGQFVTAKSNYAIKVVFKNGVEQVDPSLIGNGTVAKVKVNSFDWKFKGKTGTSLGAQKLQVISLAKYEAAADNDFEDVADNDIDDNVFDDD